MTASLVLLRTSPRVAPGLLSAQAWMALRAGRVLARTPDHPQLRHLADAGILTEIDAEPDDMLLAQRLVASARTETLVWLLSAGDDDLVSALRTVLSGLPDPPDPPELTLLEGSYDLPGARLLDLVALMNRLRSPGGCPWDARQTHESLVTYLVEETYETVEAIETGDLVHLREELGDLLLQVVFHARIAEEHADAAWSIDDVAVAIVDKLVRRHPHVFGTGSGVAADAPGADDLETTWERQKAAEKGRTSATEGIAPGLPALTLAAKLMSRAMRSGLDVQLPPDDSIGGRLLAVVADAQRAGLDPESELRHRVRRYRQEILDHEERAISNLPQ